MLLRLPVIGDLHLIQGTRNEDRLRALDDAIQHASREPVAAWLWPGDLTNSGMTIALRNALVVRVVTMGALAPVVIVRGNHDPSGDLDFLRSLRTTWPVHVVTSPQVIEVALNAAAAPPLALACVPYPPKAALVGAGIPHEQLHETVTGAFRALFAQLGADLDTARQAGQLTGCIGHVSIAGAVASCGQPQVGTELEIDATHLALLGDCFKVFNHIHRHQRVGDAVYPGSLCRTDFGEVEAKGFVVVKAWQN